VNRLADLLLCAWFLLVAVGFWSPYIGVSLPPNLANALYAAFLLVAVLALALRVVAKRQPQRPAVVAEDAAADEGEGDDNRVERSL
jgi:hypothetical protein